MTRSRDLADSADKDITGTLTVDALTSSGNITVSGTVDGRDVAADGTKLDGIEASATADQTKADIDALNINADQVDGLEASQFLRSDTNTVLSTTGGQALTLRDNNNSGTSAATWVEFEDSGSNRLGYVGMGSGSNGNLYIVVESGSPILYSGNASAPKYNDGTTEYTMWHTGNDGSGSGLDADLLDGKQGAAYFTADGATITTSTNVFLTIEQGTTSSNYAEMHIGNDLDHRIIIGTIGSAYSGSVDWSGARYIYTTAGDLRIKAKEKLQSFSGGTSMASHLSQEMDTNGHITTARNVAFNVRGDPSATYGTGWQKLTYNNGLTQRGGSNYSSTNSRFTAPVTGYYQFNAQWSASNNADLDGTFTFWKNGAVPVNTGSVSMPDTGGSYDGHTMSVAMPLTANDYVEVYRYSTVSTTSRGNSWQGNFSGFLIG